MAKKPKPTPILLRWSDYLPVSEVQDPLGLSLRGSTRLASQLLYCITSITPRARYFSFIPWCILDYQQREKDKTYKLGLREAIILREKALTLGCVAHHKAEVCNGGALIGSTEAKNWFLKGRKEANLKRLYFAKIPALDAYFNSLVNLGCFVTEEIMTDTDEEAKQPELTFDDIELSPLGQQLAGSYGSLIDRLSSVRQLVERNRKCSTRSLAEWGKRGGLCELAESTAPDRRLLRDIFFSLCNLKGESHPVRKKSLLLIMEYCRQLSIHSRVLNEQAFASAVYFGETIDDNYRLIIELPLPLVDIAARWRMFYFHHFMSVALEGLFAWLVSQLTDKGLTGASIESMATELELPTVRSVLSDHFNVKMKRHFGKTTPADFFALFGVAPSELTAKTSRRLDDVITVESSVAEIWIEGVIRKNTYLQSPAGLSLPMILLILTLARYTHWQTTRYGDWLARAASEPYLDLLPPILTEGLSRHFGNWWRCTWKELANFVLSRFVVRQHIAMSYEKTAVGDRCLLQVDGDKVISGASYEKIGMGNPRFRSAVQILKDLALLEDTEDGITVLTEEGQQLLDTVVKREDVD